MKRWLLLVVALLFAASAQAQIGYGTAKRVIYGNTVPTTCDETVGEVYFKNVAPNDGLYVCQSGTYVQLTTTTAAGAVRLVPSGTQQIVQPGGTSLQVVGDMSVSGVLTATVTQSAIGDKGFVNFKTDCHLVDDNLTDNYALFNTCHALYKGTHYVFPACTFHPQGGGTANVPCYYFSQQITVSYNGTWIDGTSPSLWNGLTSLRFPSGSGGVRFDKNCYGCKISNLGLVGGDAWASGTLSTWPDWTPAALVGNGPDGLQLLGGEPLVENVAIYSFGRHGIFLDGASGITSPDQPDAWTIRNVIIDANRANGIFTIGCDSNVGLGSKILTRGNMLTGIYDYSCLGNTWIAPDSALDGRSAISAGSNSNIVTIGDNGAGVLTITTATPVSGWNSATWVTVAGTVNYNGTYKVTGGSSSNFTATYLGTPQAGEVVGTVSTASSTNVFATLTARSAAAGQAPTKECAYSSRNGSSIQVHINPYQESNSAPPCWDTGTIVLGGQLASTVIQATGQGFVWITSVAGGLYVKGGQAFTFQNPSDSLTTFNLRAGLTADQNETIRFQDHLGANKHSIQFQSTGTLAFIDDATGASWMFKTGNGNLDIRGDSATHDLAFNRNLGQDELHYCGGGTICGKFLKSDSTFYSLNGIRPITAGGATLGSGPLPFSSAFIGAAATNNIQLIGTATAARVLTLQDVTGTVPVTIASGTSSLGTGAIGATSCATVVTTTATNALSTDGILWDFNAAPSTGYTSGVGVLAYVTAGNVNFLVCNPTAGSLTPAAATLNWRVIR